MSIRVPGAQHGAQMACGKICHEKKDLCEVIEVEFLGLFGACKRTDAISVQIMHRK